MLFVMGMILAIGVVQETEAIDWLGRQCSVYIHNSWAMGVIAAAVSAVLDTFATSLSFFALMKDLPQNDIYYKIIAFSTAAGGTVMLTGSMAGLALMKMERMRTGWYLRHIGAPVAVAWLLAMAAMYAGQHLMTFI